MHYLLKQSLELFEWLSVVCSQIYTCKDDHLNLSFAKFWLFKKATNNPWIDCFFGNIKIRGSLIWEYF